VAKETGLKKVGDLSGRKPLLRSVYQGYYKKAEGEIFEECAEKKELSDQRRFSQSLQRRYIGEKTAKKVGGALTTTQKLEAQCFRGFFF